MLIITNAAELATCTSGYKGPKIGKDFRDCGIIKNGALAVMGEKIVAVGSTERILRRFPPRRGDHIIDASGKIVMPGFVDCHTHAVYAGSRAEEYRAKLGGVSYADAHKKRGGIFLTVAATRSATVDTLYRSARNTLSRMAACGTTTVEIKSGYGLSTESELRILRVIQELARSGPLDVAATFLGAHTVPLEYEHDRASYIRMVVNTMLPAIKKEGLAEYCDVFCDPLGFTPGEARKILTAAMRHGLRVRVHAEQTRRFGGMRVAAEFCASSADHCDFARTGDIRLLRTAGTTAVLFPGVQLHLMEWEKRGRMRARAEIIKKAGVPLALATDHNPGSSPIYSLKLIADLGMRFFGLTYEECLNAITINAAHALDRGDMLGSLEAGKQADILIADAPTIAEYLHAVGDGALVYVIKKGRVLFPRRGALR